MNMIEQPVKPAAERAPSDYSAALDFETDYPTLQGSVTADVAIIGAGVTGTATAVELPERGLKVA
ncbi:FAD-dependent oxidoreductase, partial [Pseudomonas yangonensis]|uniref:FAD-dependent oxidoreductase n=1 Tax=Pseudomonas yangonensis TaxID=2579922 RepID=UPI00137B08B9